MIRRLRQFRAPVQLSKVNAIFQKRTGKAGAHFESPDGNVLNRGRVTARQTVEIVDAGFLPFHTQGMTVVEGLMSLSAAAGFLAAACWVQVARRIDAIGAMDQRAYRRSLGRAALMTSVVLIIASVAVALRALGMR